MQPRRRRSRGRLILTLSSLSLLAACADKPQMAPTSPEPVAPETQVQPGDQIRVILQLPNRAEQATLAAAARSRGGRVLHQYSEFPLLAVQVPRAALAGLLQSGRVLSYQEDVAEPAALNASIPVINADQVHALGFDGTGFAVAILDSGIDPAHPFLGGRVVSEACYSTPSGVSEQTLCPNGNGSITPGSANSTFANCLNGGAQLCDHGQHVAGIAAGDGTGLASPAPATGVAPGANIIGIQVFTRFNSAFDCSPSPAPCVASYPSDQLAGLNRVFALRSTFAIAAANMSLGGNMFAVACDADSRKVAIDALLGANIATVISAGNNGFTAAVSRPGCISTAITIGATDNADAIADFSNRGTLLDLFAPGVDNVSSLPSGLYGTKSGTSMSAPHVTGAWAVMRHADPTATVAQILARFQTTGVPITDVNSVTRSRIDLFAAVAPSLAPGTIVINKTSVPAGRTGFGFTDNIAAPNSFTLNGGGTKTFSNVVPGSYTVTESAPGAFMVLSSLSCTDPTSNTTVSGATATINVAPGETVTCTFGNTDQPPTVSASPATQTIQYSDYIGDITVTAQDSDQDALTATFAFNKNGGLFSAGLPAGMASTALGCTTAATTQTCSWTVSGIANVSAGTYSIRSTVTDDDASAVSATANVVVQAENASMTFGSGNPVAVQVAAPGGTSGAFSIRLYVEETEPDLATFAAAAGDLSNAVVATTLAPVGPGGSATGTCSQVGVVGTGYAQVLEVQCDFLNVAVNTYVVSTVVSGGYFTGGGEDVVTVYDPSLGFTTGGGTFTWPGTTERTNFGYTMKYNKKGQQIQGSLLMIRHLADGTKYRVKSNALGGLAMGNGGTFDWASFTGKATYLQPGWADAIGNYSFQVYVEDHGTPGISDRFWIRVLDPNKQVVTAASISLAAPANAVTLTGGNIAVPHQ